MAWKVLSEDGLGHIAAHKYKPGKYTPLDNVLNPFWLQLVELLPKWLAPNLVTLSGFLPIIASYILAWYFSPDFSTPVPRWVAILTAWSLFVYQTLDALDGKQARRIGASTPLGQLFDHGCDCLATLSHHSMAVLVFLPGSSRSGIAGLAALQTGFFLAQWQERYTGVLHTSFGPVGVTETQFGLMALALLAGIAGPDQVKAWAASEVQVPWASISMSLGELACLGWVLFCALIIMICLVKTITHVASGLSEGPGTPAQQLIESATSLLPVVLLNLLLFAWQPSMIQKAPRVICLVVGLLFFYYTAQMILFSMARMSFPIVQPTLIAFGCLTIASRLLPEQTHLILPVLKVFSALLCFHVFIWLAIAITELKAKLRIYAFSVTSPEAKSK